MRQWSIRAQSRGPLRHSPTPAIAIDSTGSKSRGTRHSPRGRRVRAAAFPRRWSGRNRAHKRIANTIAPGIHGVVTSRTASARGSNVAARTASQTCWSRPPNSMLMKRLATWDGPKRLATTSPAVPIPRAVVRGPCGRESTTGRTLPPRIRPASAGILLSGLPV
jgi:hypothetical protein